MARITRKEIKKIDHFKKEMIKILELPKNVEKTHWSKLCFDHLYKLLKEEVIEIQDENKKIWITGKKHYENVQKECLDVANFAFMIYDIMEQAKNYKTKKRGKQ